MENIFLQLQEWATFYGIKILAAIAILVIGRWVAKAVKGGLVRVLRKRELDETLVTFSGNLIYIVLLTGVVIAALSKIGLQTTSFVAVLGAAGLAIGLALQGSLANFAAGFLMILFKPFKAGDFIEGGGATGVVEAIHIFTTQVKTTDNKVIIVPNAKMMGDNIVNYSAKEIRRVDLTVGVGYEVDLQKARQVMLDIAARDSRILDDPGPTVAVNELADSSVNFTYRLWVKTADYWNVYFDTTETVKRRFDEEGISIPFPQRDLHVYQH